jgi:hypothetical protein
MILPKPALLPNSTPDDDYPEFKAAWSGPARES